MHTDEYEISLWRELAVCADAIKKLERRFADTLENQQALRDWSERKRQYEKLLSAMKISSNSDSVS